MTPEENVLQHLGLGNRWQVVRTELEERTTTLGSCVKETGRGSKREDSKVDKLW